MIDCRIRPIASLILPLALIACGGGGGGGSTRDLTVDFNYDPAHAFLFRPASLRLAATGLEGNSPVCAVVGGELPRGLTLQANGCAISGTPIEVASKSVTIRLTVPGFTGQIEKSIAFLSFGPPTQYPFFENLSTGTPISSIPSSTELTWSFSMDGRSR